MTNFLNQELDNSPLTDYQVNENSKLMDKLSFHIAAVADLNQIIIESPLKIALVQFAILQQYYQSNKNADINIYDKPIVQFESSVPYYQNFNHNMGMKKIDLNFVIPQYDNQFKMFDSMIVYYLQFLHFDLFLHLSKSKKWQEKVQYAQSLGLINNSMIDEIFSNPDQYKELYWSIDDFKEF